MSKKDSQFQKKVMSFWYRGKGIFKPLNTGWIDEHVACVREWIANGNFLQMHSDKSISDVNTGISPDLFHGHGILKMVVFGRRTLPR